MLQSPVLHQAERFYQFFIRIGSNLQSLFLFYMRATWGHQFFLAGLSKIKAIQPTIDFFISLGIPAPVFHAYLVSYVELIGGFLLFIGLASRLAALPLAFTMLVALSTAHAANLSNFQFLMQPILLVKEAPYPFLITSLLVFIFGPGRISVDAWLKRQVDHLPRY